MGASTEVIQETGQTDKDEQLHLTEEPDDVWQDELMRDFKDNQEGD